MHAVHDLVEPILTLHQLIGTSSERSQALQKRFVHGPVDSQRENAEALDAFRQAAEDLILVTDLAVSDQYENQVVLALAGGELLDSQVERLRHLGAAASRDSGQELDSPEAVPIHGWHQTIAAEFRRRLHPVVERVNGKAIMVGVRIDHAGV